MENLSAEQSAKQTEITRKLQQREEERQQENDKRQSEKQTNWSIADPGKLGEFRHEFQEQVNKISKEIATSTESSLEEAFVAFNNLRDRTTDMELYLPRYEIKQKLDVIKDLHVKLLSQRDSKKKTSKFAFKKSKPHQPSSTSDSGNNLTLSNVKTPSIERTEASVIVEKRTGEVITLEEFTVKGKDIILTELVNCTVRINGSPGAVHLRDIKSTSVLCGPCSRSMLVREVENCVIAMACQQLRIHDSKYCDFHIHVTSSAIIEDSSNLRFAPYTLQYDNLSEHYKQSMLDLTLNNWDKVVDFNWLVTDRQSPNWQTINNAQSLDFNRIPLLPLT